MDGVSPTFPSFSSTSSSETPDFNFGGKNTEWAYQDDDIMDKFLAECSHDNSTAGLPAGNMVEQISNPYYKETVEVDKSWGVETSSGLSNYSAPTQQRQKGVRWTEEEHKWFLMGLEKYGKGEWVNISRFYVVTKTASQVASHAQKHFRRLNCTTPYLKRRCSIHDIRMVNSNIVEMPPRLVKPTCSGEPSSNVLLQTTNENLYLYNTGAPTQFSAEPNSMNF